MRVYADGHVTDHIFVHARLTLQLGDGVARSFNVEHHEMRFAVLLNFVGQCTKTPGFGLYDLALIVFYNLGGSFCQRINLGL